MSNVANRNISKISAIAEIVSVPFKNNNRLGKSKAIIIFKRYQL